MKNVTVTTRKNMSLSYLTKKSKRKVKSVKQRLVFRESLTRDQLYAVRGCKLATFVTMTIMISNNNDICTLSSFCHFSFYNKNNKNTYFNLFSLSFALLPYLRVEPFCQIIKKKKPIFSLFFMKNCIKIILTIFCINNIDLP